MNFRCAACAHPERSRAEMLIAGGASINSVSQKFGIHKDAMRRHWLNHVSSERKTALIAGPVPLGELAERATAENESVLDQLKHIRTQLYRTFDTAAEAGDRMGTAMLSGRLHENLTIVAKLTGELMRHATPQITQNILVHPDLMRIMDEIRRAVSPFPEARRAVISCFDKLEADALARLAKPEPVTIEASRA